MAFLCLVPGVDGVGEVLVVHRLIKYLDTPGDDPTGFNDKVLGLLGDILPHQYPVVEVPVRSFTWSGQPYEYRQLKPWRPCSPLGKTPRLH